MKTPILILHSDNDYRVPLEQGEQWFRALKHYGVNAELVIFPRENHNLTRMGEPKHLMESLNWQCHWFDRFLTPSGRTGRLRAAGTLPSPTSPPCMELAAFPEGCGAHRQ